MERSSALILRYCIAAQIRRTSDANRMTGNDKENGLRLDAFDYELPPELIAQEPTAERDQSRLLSYRRRNQRIAHHAFTDLPDLLTPKDVLVINDSKVIPARLRGKKPASGGNVEILLINEQARNQWWVMLKPGKRAHPGTRVQLQKPDGTPAPIEFEIEAKNSEGHCLVRFEGTPNILDELDELGEIPLPPYIEAANTRDYNDKERYQTIYANQRGSVAAPTAGLHFSPRLFEALEAKGIPIVRVTLHVGIGTFAPVKASRIAEHQMHHEYFQISESAARQLSEFKAQGRRIIAVGTTSVRVLESAAQAGSTEILPQRDRTNIFIYPPHNFHFVDGLITNFHLPKSSLLMLISAMACPGQVTGIDHIRSVYEEAIRERYRFFSYGDAMFIE